MVSQAVSCLLQPFQQSCQAVLARCDTWCFLLVSQPFLVSMSGRSGQCHQPFLASITGRSGQRNRQYLLMSHAFLAGVTPHSCSCLFLLFSNPVSCQFHWPFLGNVRGRFRLCHQPCLLSVTASQAVSVSVIGRSCYYQQPFLPVSLHCRCCQCHFPLQLLSLAVFASFTCRFEVPYNVHLLFAFASFFLRKISHRQDGFHYSLFGAVQLIRVELAHARRPSQSVFLLKIIQLIRCELADSRRAPSFRESE